MRAWEVCEGAEHRLEIVESPGQPLPTRKQPEQVVIARVRDYPTWSEAKANAATMAVARELLADVKALRDACYSLMGEVCKKSVTDWGLVNDALVTAARTIDKAENP